MKSLLICLLATVAATGPALAAGPSWSNAFTSVTGPQEPSDAQLEQIVRAAYSAASTYARAHGNYFARDGVFTPLRDSIEASLVGQGFADIAVPAEPATDLAATNICLVMSGAELRIGVNAYGDGVSLVAVTSHRGFSYQYDPHGDGAIVVAPAADCRQPG